MCSLVFHPFNAFREVIAIPWAARNHMDVHVAFVLGKIGESDMEPIHLKPI